jgi:predicted acylesterase/phospholipase RssA
MHADLSPASGEEFALVFEGGGAKGVAYVGALRALEQRGLQIRATAGASAGAITATLVAAGFDASRLENELHNAMHHLAAQIVPSEGHVRHHRIARVISWQQLLSRLRKQGAALDTSQLRTWLADLLHEKVPQWNGTELRGDEITFKQLYSVTEIELYVVAANVSRHEQIVFSHKTTPKCQVVDAVLASSAIPGALPSGKLEVEESWRRSSPTRLHTIVDGGVWANYPEFVFTDSYFRQLHGLGELRQRVVGFVLDETGRSIFDLDFDGPDADEQGQGPSYETARFSPPGMRRKLPRTEAVMEGDSQPPSVPHLRWLAPIAGGVALAALLLAIVGRVVLGWFQGPLAFFSMLGLFFMTAAITILAGPIDVERGAGIDDCWPRNGLLRFVRTSLIYLRPGYAAFAVGILGLIVVLALAADPGIHAATTPSEYVELLLLIFFEMVFVFALGFLIVSLFASVALLALSRRAIADSGWGVVRTYAAGPGAPAWRGKAPGDWVVRVPIPSEVSTLSFAIDDKVLREMLQKAEQSASRQLKKILGH